MGASENKASSKSKWGGYMTKRDIELHNKKMRYLKSSKYSKKMEELRDSVKEMGIRRKTKVRKKQIKLNIS